MKPSPSGARALSASLPRTAKSALSTMLLFGERCINPQKQCWHALTEREKQSQASWYLLTRLSWGSVYWEAYGDIIASIARMIKPLLPPPQKIKIPPLLKSMAPAMETFKVPSHTFGPGSVHVFQFCCVITFAKSTSFSFVLFLILQAIPFAYPVSNTAFYSSEVKRNFPEI